MVGQTGHFEGAWEPKMQSAFDQKKIKAARYKLLFIKGSKWSFPASQHIYQGIFRGKNPLDFQGNVAPGVPQDEQLNLRAP